MPSETPLLRRAGIPLLFVFLWSTGFIGAKYGLPYAEPWTFLWMRHGITALLLISLIPLFHVQWPKHLKQIAHLMVVGVLVHGIYLGGVFFAIHRGMEAGMSALIVGLQPLLTVILSAIWIREPVGRNKFTGLMLGLVGIILVIGHKGIGIEGVNSLSLIACIAALAGISVGTIYQKRYCTEIDLLPGVCIQYMGSGGFMLLLATVFESGEVEWHGKFVFAMAWLVIVLSIGAVLLLMWLIRHGEAGKTASLFYLVPAFTSVEAWLLFNETLSLPAMAGIALCLIGVAMVVNAPSTQK